MIINAIVLSIFVLIISIFLVILYVETIQTTNDITRKRKRRLAKKHEVKNSDPYFDIYYSDKKR